LKAAQLGTFLGVAALSGCASVPREMGYADVGRMVADRTGQETFWDRGTPEDAEVKKRVADLLRADLTDASAVQIALLNNPGLQATYEELGVAQGDLVQAGLLRNPSLGFAVRIPEGPTGVVSTDFSLAQDFLDIFMLPLRKRLAAEQFEQAKLRLAGEVFLLVGKVRQDYYALQALGQMVELRRTVLEAAQASAELAQRQLQAGNIADLELETQRDAYEQAKLDLAHDELLFEAQRERLTRLMGLWGPQTGWKFSSQLPELPVSEEALDHLESIAIARRLDVASARQETRILAQALHVANTSRFVGSVEIGVSRQTGPEPGIRVTGPTLRLELPIFDRRQGLIRRIEAQLRQSEKRLASASVDARSEVRSARLTLLSARQVVDHYRNVLLPIRERTVKLSQERYNAMLLSVFQLLLAKQAEVDAYRRYIEAVRDYWIARVELERAAGGTLKPIADVHSDGQPTVAPQAPSDKAKKEGLR
jgi:cobalt-zinc-cadmium efflux system outer membrane protein